MAGPGRWKCTCFPRFQSSLGNGTNCTYVDSSIASSQTSLIIGIVIALLVFVSFIIAFVVYRRRTKPKKVSSTGQSFSAPDPSLSHDAVHETIFDYKQGETGWEYSIKPVDAQFAYNNEIQQHYGWEAKNSHPPSTYANVKWNPKLQLSSTEIDPNSEYQEPSESFHGSYKGETPVLSQYQTVDSAAAPIYADEAWDVSPRTASKGKNIRTTKASNSEAEPESAYYTSNQPNIAALYSVPNRRSAGSTQSQADPEDDLSNTYAQPGAIQSDHAPSESHDILAMYSRPKKRLPPPPPNPESAQDSPIDPFESADV